jgi:hypothetical protein
MSSSKLSGNKPIVLTFVVVLVAIAAVVGYFLMNDKNKPVATESIKLPAVVVATRIEETLPEPVALPEPGIVVDPAPREVPEPAFVLPLLDDSDQLLRDGVVSLTRNEGVNVWLAPNQLIRKFVAVVDNVAQGQVAKEPARSLAPQGPFLVKKIDDEIFEIDPASYNRYNQFTTIAISMDARRAAEFYHLLRPMLQDAYEELGYGNKPFDDVLFESIGRLLETPIIDGPIRVVQPVVMYKFEEDRLESLSPAQKQMIRMGPKNTRLLQAKISEVALELRAILGR